MYFKEEQSINSIHSAQQLREMEQNKECYFDPKTLNQFIKDTDETLRRQDKSIEDIRCNINNQNEMIADQFSKYDKELIDTKRYNKWMMLIAIIAGLAAVGSFLHPLLIGSNTENLVISNTNVNWGNIIALLALAITIIRWIIDIYKNRTAFNAYIENVEQVTLNGHREIIIVFTIINKSTAPLNITRIGIRNKAQLQINNKLRKSLVMTHSWPKYPETDIPCTERVFSTEFPTHIEPRGSQHVIAVFKDELSSDEYQKGDIIQIVFSTDKKDIHKKCSCVTCSKEDLRWLY